MNIGQLLKNAEKQLKSAGIRTAHLDALILFEKASSVKREWILAHPNRSVSNTTKAQFESLIKRRAQRIPISQLVGKQEFWGLEFRVTKDVLAPRPESEKIVEFALEQSVKKAEVLDVGTGCGALAIALASEKPSWRITASEISEKALSVARTNVKAHQVNVKCVKSNLLAGISGKYDIVVANLPYLKKGAELTVEARSEPKIALFGGKDGLDLYRLFFTQLPPFLNLHAIVIIESDPWQQSDLIKLASSIGLHLKSQDRFVLSFSN